MRFEFITAAKIWIEVFQIMTQ